MSILTPNRILEKGDQYNEGGAWKPVPKEELGLQIIFSKLKKYQLRRPSEKDFPTAPTAEGNLKQAAQDRRKPDAVRKEHDREIPQLAASRSELSPGGADNGAERGGKPISQDSVGRESKQNAANAESEQVARPLVARGPGERSEEMPEASAAEIERAGLPTVVSKKAHAVEESDPSAIRIKFPPPKTGVLDEQPIWTGRNGTFQGYGLDLTCFDGKVMISPIGKRGPGNCTIQFPISTIPELVDWLNDSLHDTHKIRMKGNHQ